MTQIKKRININSFFRGGWATGWGCFGSLPSHPVLHPAALRAGFSLSLSLYLLLSRCSYFYILSSLFFSFRLSFTPTFRPLSFFSPLQIHRLFSFFPLFLSFKFHSTLSVFSREQAIHERLRRSVKLVSTTNSGILKGIANAIGCERFKTRRTCYLLSCENSRGMAFKAHAMAQCIDLVTQTRVRIILSKCVSKRCVDSTETAQDE